EMYFNRLLYKSFKSFCMSYARFETRSVYHSLFGNRSGSIIPRALFDSDFLQQRYAFSSVLRTSPMGVIGVDASNDLYGIDKRITASHLATYGRMQRLFAEIKDCVAVWDGGRWGYYLHSGGLIFGTLLTNHHDSFDLDEPVVAGFMQVPGAPVNFSRNKAVRGIVVNQAWVGAGIPYVTMPFTSPMYIVGEEQAKLWREDSTNPLLMDRAKTVETVEAGIQQAMEKGQTDKVIVFDGSYGHVTCNAPMAEFLKAHAAKVDQEVETDLLPKWLAQRGLAQGLN
ncbi:MAG: hypothetical protein JO303_06865, partial [Caulobacteraceae bacterium]|nr:hypothetical protein [Caulobacteraceae bacterium]